MPQYQVVVSDDMQVEVDVPPGSPALRTVELSYEAHTPEQLRELVDALAFDPMEMDPHRALQSRYALPLTRDGDEVGSASVSIWLRGALAERHVVSPPLAALVDLREAAAREEVRDG